MRWVFRSYLNIHREAAGLLAIGRSFYHLGTRQENSLHCLKHGIGTATQQSIAERSGRVVT